MDPPPTGKHSRARASTPRRPHASLRSGTPGRENQADLIPAQDRGGVSDDSAGHADRRGPSRPPSPSARGEAGLRE